MRRKPPERNNEFPPLRSFRLCQRHCAVHCPRRSGFGGVMMHAPMIAHLFGQEVQDILKALVPAMGMLLLVAAMSWFWNPGRDGHA